MRYVGWAEGVYGFYGTRAGLIIPVLGVGASGGTLLDFASETSVTMVAVFCRILVCFRLMLAGFWAGLNAPCLDYVIA